MDKRVSTELMDDFSTSIMNGLDVRTLSALTEDASRSLGKIARR